VLSPESILAVSVADCDNALTAGESQTIAYISTLQDSFGNFMPVNLNMLNEFTVSQGY
jgi:hypothetical protein